MDAGLFPILDLEIYKNTGRIPNQVRSQGIFTRQHSRLSQDYTPLISPSAYLGDFPSYFFP